MSTSGSLSTIYNFTGPDGEGPRAGLIVGNNGSLYGTTVTGGIYGYGSVFEATPSVAQTGTAVAFNYHILGTNGPNSYTAMGLPAGLSLNNSTGLISGTAAQTGTFTIPLSATNDGGTGSGTLTIVVLPPVVITSATSVSGTTGVPFSYQITGNSNPGSYLATGLPTGLSMSTQTGLISGTPAVSGTYGVTIGAANQSGTTTEALSLAVNPIPVINSTLIETGSDDFSFSYQVTTINTATSYSESGLPAGLTLDPNSGIISGTLATTGTFNVTITAINQSGSESATLTIGAVLPPVPSITSASSVTGTDAGTLNYQIVATENPQSFTATGLPASLTLNTATGLISGTATVSGTYSVPITATNPGGTANATLTIKLLPTPPAPSITSSLTVTGSDGLALSYQITASNGPTSFGATGLPAGLGLNSATGVISGTPSVTGTFSVPISATNLGGAGNATLTINSVLPPAPVITGLQTLVYFTGTSGTAPGAQPAGSLLLGSDGNVYGTTQGGGSGSRGTVFKMTPAGALTVLTSFTGTSGTSPGSNPVAGLLQSGTLFLGTTEYGGGSNAGTIFDITSSGSLTSIYSFTGGYDGGNPLTGVVQAPNTNFYTMTYNGEIQYNEGTIFQFNTRGLAGPIYDFGAAGQYSGVHPQGPLILGGDGYFYGTTYSGGTANYGTVFKFLPTGAQTLCSFSPGTGVYPMGGVVLAGDGNYYGTLSGSAKGYGSVFQMTPSGSVSVFYAFSGNNGQAPGQAPSSSLTEGADGNLYGMAEYGGRGGGGAIFRITPGVSGTTLYSFSSTTSGSNPLGGLAQASDGNSFYGTTAEGGNGYGTIFQLYSTTVFTATNRTFNYPIIATNSPSTYNATGLPPGLTLNATSGTISGRATATGTYNVVASAANAGGTANENLTIIVEGSTPVVTTSGTLFQAGLNEGFGLQVTASNNPTSYSASGVLPWGMFVNPVTGEIAGQPYVTGTYNFTINASNLLGTGQENVTIAVVAAPSITSGLSVSGTENSPFSYQIAASSSPSGFGAGGLPAGLSVDPVAGMISGTPTASGTFTVAISATNAAGTANANLTLTLQPASNEVPALSFLALVALAVLLIFAGVAFLRRGRSQG
jgi:uncharacterized repeat protein (TIGR03803 family)